MNKYSKISLVHCYNTIKRVSHQCKAMVIDWNAAPNKFATRISTPWNRRVVNKHHKTNNRIIKVAYLVIIYFNRINGLEQNGRVLLLMMHLQRNLCTMFDWAVGLFRQNDTCSHFALFKRHSTIDTQNYQNNCRLLLKSCISIRFHFYIQNAIVNTLGCLSWSWMIFAFQTRLF